VTPLTEPDDRIIEIAESIEHGAASPLGRTREAFEWATTAIRYWPGVTGVRTTAAEALAGGEGVCQDFTHILLALLRRLGIPCRYVSGHLVGEGAPHAWVQALVPDEASPGGQRVLSWDPTNRVEPGLGSICVAVGRDFADVTPTSGWFVGQAQSQLSYSRQIQVVDITYVAPKADV
jgi:transglutaminase-like putative cysteine protease